MALHLVTFCLVCCSFHLVLNQLDATKLIKPLNYAVKDQRIRVKRKEDFQSCNDNRKVDKKSGFRPFSRKDLNVQFFKDPQGKASVYVTWKTPNSTGMILSGYWFAWMVPRDTNFQSDSSKCTYLPAENTSFVVQESKDWKKDEYISFGVNPLPSNSDAYPICYPFQPIFKAPSTNVNTPSTTSVKTKTATQITQSTNSGVTSKSVPDGENLARQRKKEIKEKETFTIAIVAIASAAAVSLLGFILVFRYRKRSRLGIPSVSREPGYIYVSYCKEGDSYEQKVVDFCSWFCKEGYDVQMDTMLTSKNQEDLKELGRLRWGQKQLVKATNVFIILSPSYLNLCRLDEGETDASSLTQDEMVVYSEITQIRNALSKTAYINSRFIPVLFGVKETELPFWIKQLVVYNWPDDKINDKLLYRMNEEASYNRQENTSYNNA